MTKKGQRRIPSNSKESNSVKKEIGGDLNCYEIIGLKW